jgi:3-oxoadipate enol-lactonase
MELVWKDATLLLERLETGPVHLCGLSMGGFVAMRMAARRPELVRSLILIATSADPEPMENIPRYRLLAALGRVAGPRLAARRIERIMLGPSFRADPARRAERARYVELMTRRRDVWKALNGLLDRAGVHDELPRIAAPTLVLVGDEDEVTPPARAARLAEGLKDARLVPIPRAGHSTTVEEPRAVTAAIEAFLGSLQAQP